MGARQSSDTAARVQPVGVGYLADGVGLLGLVRVPHDQRFTRLDRSPNSDLDWITCTQILYSRSNGWDWASATALLDEAMAALNEDLEEQSVGPPQRTLIRRTACNFGLLLQALDARSTASDLLEAMGQRRHRTAVDVVPLPIGGVLLEGSARLADFWINWVEQGAVEALVGDDVDRDRHAPGSELAKSADLKEILRRLNKLVGSVRGSDSPEARPSRERNLGAMDPALDGFPTTDELRRDLRDRVRIIFDMVAQASASVQLGLVREQFQLAQNDSARQAERDARTRQFEKGLALAGTLLLIPTMVATVFGANVNALASGAHGSVLGVVGWMVGAAALTAVLVRFLQVSTAEPDEPGQASSPVGRSVLGRLIPERFAPWLAALTGTVIAFFVLAFTSGGSQTMVGAGVAITGCLAVLIPALTSALGTKRRRQTL